MNDRLTFVTVVFSGDLPLLRLQARSMARMLAPSVTREILIVMNDVDEPALRAGITDILDEYGPLREKIRIVSGDEVLRPGKRPDRRRSAWEIAYVENRHNIPFMRTGGWRGGNGYRLQQALKLASARAVAGERMVILDAKNLFLRPPRDDEFFDANGKPIANREPLGPDYHRGWLAESMDILSVPDHLRDVSETTGYSTPYPITRRLALDVLTEVETMRGPVQALFASKRRPSEFMLIFCHCLKHYGSADAVFGRTEHGPAGIWTEFDDAMIDAVLDRAESNAPVTLGLHRNVRARLTALQRTRILDLFDVRGIDVRSLLPAGSH